ncbi:MAG: hypothetical protein Q4F95_05455 [Oscillospiraceae bacterium]|nr:hypothetical protein [Oscillospiraceae bacterium]
MQLIRFNELVRKVQNYTNVNLSGYLENNILPDVTQTIYSQAMLTCISNYVVYDECIKNAVYPDCLMGYSLGLTNALYCSGSITLRDLSDLTYSVARCIGNSVKECAFFDMGTIIGLDMEDVKKLITENNCSQYVFIASENSEYFIVISGLREYVEIILDKAISAGALKAKALKTNFAFHTHMIDKYIDDFYCTVENVNYSDTRVPIMSIYTQKLICKADELREELRKNIVSCMKWRKTVECIENTSTAEFWDMSPDCSNKKSTVLKSNSVFNTLKSLENYKTDMEEII